MEAAGVSVKVRDSLEESLRAVAAPADRGPSGRGEAPSVRALGWIVSNARSPSFQPLSCRLALLFSSHRLLKLTAADDGFLCSVYDKHHKTKAKVEYLILQPVKH